MGYFRSPKTKQAKRMAEADLVDGVPVRGKRTPANIPDSYDDINVAAWRDRCWKRFRKFRYWRVASQ
jgi:hypothetical protein